MLKTISEIKSISKRVIFKQSEMDSKYVLKKSEVHQEIMQGRKSLAEKSKNFENKYNRFF
ncbi:hypothetical protein [Streptococcus sp. ZY19097]|uniref:hypothetical protein n=1 Tax=Streptococcus sp. ZY19097 TaxID=3231906 RepID=UPI002A7B681E|nr:hypothetical protein [Streptococcus equi subsp. zooepidemicus]HEL1084249.1 hypothetical protein [Streptococcus equi subsp. zooepidemicus]